MGYVFDFDIGSALFFSLFVFFYLYQKRLRGLQDRIFTAMLFASLIAVVFDFVAAAMEYRAAAYPVWALYAANMTFIFGMQTCLPLFFLYAVAVSGKFKYFSPARAVLAAIPYAATMALLFLSPFIRFGICYIDAAHIYRHGPTHAMLYVNMSFYVIAGVVVLLRNSHAVQKTKRNVILLFVAVLFTAMVLQLAFPRYLLTASATALALTSLYYVLQSPVDQVDPLTGAFSRTLLPSLLQDFIDRGRDYTLLLFSLRSFDEFVRLHGDAAGDDLLKAYSQNLMGRFPEDVVVYMDTSEFTVVRPGAMSRPEAEALHAGICAFAAVGGRNVPLDVRMGVVPYVVDENSVADSSIADYMLRQMRLLQSESLVFADEAYKKTCAATMRLESSLNGLFARNRMPVTLQRIADAAGNVAAEEARFALPEEAARYVSYDQFLQAVGQNGQAWDYYAALLGALASRRAYYGAKRRLCLTLLPAVFLQEDAREQMTSLLAGFGFAPSQILFAMGESEIAASVPVLRENVRAFAESGFAFMVDSFAEGYTDMALLASLPLTFIRLHESLVKGADTPRAAALLKGLLEILANVGVHAVCPGVDTEAEARIALAAGASLLQGACIGGGVRSLCAPAIENGVEA